MATKFGSWLKHGWNLFTNKDPTDEYQMQMAMEGPYTSYSPTSPRLFVNGNDRTTIAAIYTRIAIDVAQMTIIHARTDENGRFIETIKSDLNNCLNVEANIDQTSTAFVQDIVMSMFDEGVVAVVPVDTTINPMVTNSFDIQTMRVGRIKEWAPMNVKVEIYNDRSGRKEEIFLPKSKVAIIENPFYAVMNEKNSTLQRLNRKIGYLDSVDAQNSSGKLDLIVKLPYMVKSENKKKYASERMASIEEQLTGSKYGIAYVDATEQITQLNRPIENGLQAQIEYLTRMLYSQLSMTPEIINGSASPEQMNNYFSQTIEPIVSAIVDEFSRKFLTKTARTQYQTIMFFRDPFRFVPVNEIANMADKFTRNEIMTSNEFRQVIGMKAADDPGADELRNKNLSQSKEEIMQTPTSSLPDSDESE